MLDQIGAALREAWAALAALPLLGPILAAILVLGLGWRVWRLRRRRAGHRGRPLDDLSLGQLRHRLRTQVRRADARERLLARPLAQGLDERAALIWTLDKLERDRRTWQ